MDSYIKIDMDTHINIRMVPTASTLNKYNKPTWRYICDEGILTASPALHELLKAQNKGAGTSAILGKRAMTNAKGEPYSVFTVDGKTLKEVGGSPPPIAPPVSTPPEYKPAPPVSTPTPPSHPTDDTPPKKQSIDLLTNILVTLNMILKELQHPGQPAPVGNEDLPF